MPKVTLTPSLVDKVVCPIGQSKLDLFDTRTLGLMLEVRHKGKTYYLRYQTTQRKTKQMRLAKVPDVSLAQARQLVQEARTKIAMGEDPAATKAAERKIPTLGEFVRDRYLPYIQGYKRSWKSDETLLRLHILPVFGRKRIDGINTAEITAFQHAIKAKGYAPGTANRILTLMRYLFSLAARWEVEGAGSNPARKVELLKLNNEQQTFLSREQVATLLEAVEGSENPQLIQIVKFLLLTGAGSKRDCVRSGVSLISPTEPGSFLSASQVDPAALPLATP